MKEKSIRKDYVYKGRIINVRVDEVVLPNNKTSKREIVEHNGAVGIVAITEKGEILLVEQYRKPAEQVLLEIPAGKLEKGELPFECAERELLEETGYRAEKIIKIAEFYTSPGFATEKITLFYAPQIIKSTTTACDPDEFLELKKIPLEKALDMIKKGVIKDAKTIAGVLLANQQNL